jgi:hypothetical protein
MRWSGLPSTTISLARPCAGAWRKNELTPWRKDMWCIPQVDGEFVARVEDVLDLYAEVPDRKRSVVRFDESPTQLIGEVRRPIKAKPGQMERYDCEYKRNGTANLFINVHRPWRKVKVTDISIKQGPSMHKIIAHFPIRSVFHQSRSGSDRE